MNKPASSSYRSMIPLLWDLWCIVSIVGIWPRFIEPNLISVSSIKVKLPHLPDGLKHFKIVQFSDLHLYPQVSDAFLQKIHHKIQSLSPDLIVFTGDFLCYADLSDEKRLKNFLSSFKAPFGCYAALGNHDYKNGLSINAKGDYDVIENNRLPLSKAFSQMFHPVTLTKRTAVRARDVPLNQKLIELIKETPFELLHNVTKTISVRKTKLNLCGLGEFMSGHFQPEQAFERYDRQYPGLVLSHNPDSIPLLEKYPGDIILCGHTHGGQVNLPWLWKKFTLLENMQFKKGLFRLADKWAYVNRGIGSILPFRWFSPPEILILTLE